MNLKNKNLLRICVIILTYNEEKNIENCLKNICGWAEKIYIVDSFSTDRSLNIARGYTDKIYQHRFENYAQQRNWALDSLPIDTEWIMFLDADEYLTDDLKKEIESILHGTEYDGFFLKRRFYFMGRWIKHGGYYPTWILRLFKRGMGRVEREVNEHVAIDGKVGYLKSDLVDFNCKGFRAWLEKHIKYSEMEAKLLFNQKKENEEISFKRDFIKGTPDRKKKWLRYKVYNNSPLFLRPFLYFFYRYFIRLGFLDGKEGFLYHFLHGFIYRFLIDVFYFEILMSRELNIKKTVD